MNRLLILLAPIGILVGCSPSTHNATYNFMLPPDLAHCAIIQMVDGNVGGDVIYLIKCPPGTVPDGYIGASTSQSKGKHRQMVTSTIVE